MPLHIDITYLIVEGLITSLVLAVAFEYDRWRTEHETQLTVFERVGVQFVATVVVMAALYWAAHNRLSINGTTFKATAYQSNCLGKMCPAVG